jgi:hypothetical protein
MTEGNVSTLRAVVVGAGWAGEGHTVALQHAAWTALPEAPQAYAGIAPALALSV